WTLKNNVQPLLNKGKYTALHTILSSLTVLQYSNSCKTWHLLSKSELRAQRQRQHDMNRKCKYFFSLLSLRVNLGINEDNYKLYHSQSKSVFSDKHVFVSEESSNNCFYSGHSHW
ncbi:unnamed protein product, partial [Bubo scandiacus]